MKADGAVAQMPKPLHRLDKFPLLFPQIRFSRR